MTITHTRTRIAGLLLAAGVATVGFAGSATAKEIGSGGTGGVTTTTCNPVSNLTYKGDPTTSDTGFATIQVDYGVKPCDKNPVVVKVRMYESATPTNEVYNDPNAPQSGRFTVGGVKVSFSYQVTVSVYDANTGVLSGSKTIYAAAVRKGGV